MLAAEKVRPPSTTGPDHRRTSGFHRGGGGHQSLFPVCTGIPQGGEGGRAQPTSTRPSRGSLREVVGPAWVAGGGGAWALVHNIDIRRGSVLNNLIDSYSNVIAAPYLRSTFTNLESLPPMTRQRTLRDSKRRLLVWDGMGWHGMPWDGMAWRGMLCYGMGWLATTYSWVTRVPHGDQTNGPAHSCQSMDHAP